MSEIDEVLIILPILPRDLEIIQSILAKNRSFVTLLTGNVYEAVQYRNPNTGFTSYSALLDRNAYTRIAALSKTTPIPKNQLDDHRWAAAIVAFSQLAEINFDYSSSLHEYAFTHSGQAALDDLKAFTASDNAELNPVVDFAVGRVDHIPTGAFPHSLSVKQETPPHSEFEKPITYFRWNYAFILKAAEISLSNKTAPERFKAYWRWMRDDFCFGAPATMWASIYFARGCPDGMLDITSKASLTNAAWDLTIVQEWRRRAVPGQEAMKPWLLISRDKIVQKTASRLFASSDEEMFSFFTEDWGNYQGTILAKEYLEMMASLNDPARVRNPDPWAALPEVTTALEKTLKISST